MPTRILLSLAALAVAIPLAANAQGTVRGAEQGAAEGGRVGGPLGAIVGGAVGAATGMVGGILGVDDRPRFREYVVRERRPSYRYREEVRVGVRASGGRRHILRGSGRIHAPGYRYTYVHERPVIVEARSRRIVEIID